MCSKTIFKAATCRRHARKSYGCYSRVYELGIRGYLLDLISSTDFTAAPPPTGIIFLLGFAGMLFLLRSIRPALAAFTFGQLSFTVTVPASFLGVCDVCCILRALQTSHARPPPSGNSPPCWWSQGSLPVPRRGPRSIAVWRSFTMTVLPVSFASFADYSDLHLLLGPVAEWATMVYQPGVSMGCWLVAP